MIRFWWRLHIGNDNPTLMEIVMPHWDKQGREEWICQVGEHICTGNSTWIEGIGNCCRGCEHDFNIDYAAKKRGFKYRLNIVNLPSIYVKHLSDIGPVYRQYPTAKVEVTELK